MCLLASSATRRRWHRARRVTEFMAGTLGTRNPPGVGRADALSLLREMYGSSQTMGQVSGF
jgi:hypothetical protein